MTSLRAWALLVVSVTGLLACTGLIGGRDGAEGKQRKVPIPALTAELAAHGSVRRLTQIEYEETVWDLLGDSARNSRAFLPDDANTPFDNDYTTQIASQALVEGAENLAAGVVDRTLADAARRDRVVGCTPKGAADADCFGSFVKTFGRRAFRRPLTEPETTRYAAAHALSVQANDFYAGVRVVLSAILQDPKFLYRIEKGELVPDRPGLYKLNGFEIATRLSYFILGTTPSDALLSLAEAGKLSSPAQVYDTAVDLLNDSRAERQIDRFHSLWLGYALLPHAVELSAAMRDETAALIKRVIFDEDRPWQDLFRAGETFISDKLAQHYGLPSPGATPTWVSYGTSGRRGILSHGSFLALGATGEDTDPTQRGLAIRRRLLCDEVPPRPANVPPAPEPTSTGTCKPDRLKMHQSGGCAACHSLMDPIGFGLENYDKEGRFRVHEMDRPDCPIEGKGTVAGLGDFRGPAELGDLILSSGVANACLSKQLYRFAIGRSSIDEIDGRVLAAIDGRFGKGDFKLRELIADFVGSAAFIHLQRE